MMQVIKEYNGRYTVDDLGNVYSNNKLMHPFLINSGYLAIKLRNKGKVKTYLIHRLVAECFLNGSGVGNLRYCTQKENLDYYGHDYNSGNNHYKSIFSLDDISFIRRCRETNNMRNKDIYKLFPNASHSAIDQVLNYKTYKKIPC